MSTIGKLRTVRRKSPINLSSMHCALQEFSPIDHPERIEIGNAPGLFWVYEIQLNTGRGQAWNCAGRVA
ncbi:hypothetical protein WJ972_06415 [Achromobacter insuavis]